jgi:hypothetical protein
MAAALGAGGVGALLGAAQGIAGAGAEKRKLAALQRGISDPALIAFLNKFFPSAVVGGKFEHQFLSDAASRNATSQSNIMQRLMQLFGNGGQAPQAGAINASAQLAGNVGLNQAGLGLAQHQARTTQGAIPLQFQRALMGAGLGVGLGQTSQTAAGLTGAMQGAGAGLTAFGQPSQNQLLG